jgi:tRNA U34 5-carboxymethylaminomethyl modifying GTPase MnmE/TrmE
MRRKSEAKLTRIDCLLIVILPMADQKKIIFLGNTGSGKSTLLNLLGGQFEAGLSDGDGLTREYSARESRLRGFAGTILVDTPGLIEERQERVDENARQITLALKSGGSFKIVYVSGDTAGRISRETVILLRKLKHVLPQEAEIGFIFNKTPAKDYEEIVRLAPRLLRRYSLQMDNRIVSPALVLKMADGELEDVIKAENADALGRFIESMEPTVIKPADVKELALSKEELEWWEAWWEKVKDYFMSGDAVASTLSLIKTAGQVALTQIAVEVAKVLLEEM